jgi:hypothetical protein
MTKKNDGPKELKDLFKFKALKDSHASAVKAVKEQAKAAAGPTNALPSIPGIVDPMLETGKYTRAEIMAKVRELRPDFKDPSAAVSNGFIRLRKQGKEGHLIEVERPRRAGRPTGPSQRTVADRHAKIDAWAARMDLEIAEGFAKRDKFMAQPRQPMRRIWP